jgi:hypothetical protein
MDGTDSAPLPESFGAVLDDHAYRGDMDLAFSLLRAESRGDRRHGLVRDAGRGTSNYLRGPAPGHLP